MMTDIQANRHKLAKNTFVLYFRMIIIMLVSLYTSRVVLSVLGVEDFGVFNVVGGFVSIFSLISGSMATTISRYLTFELGKNDKNKLRVVFCTSVNIQIGLSFLILLLAEAFGIWFLNCKMNIPDSRMEAANWVFQFSLLSFCVNLINVPYSSVIIAHEKMTSFAYFSITETLLKLGIVFLLSESPFDHLVTYSFLLLAVTILMRLGYVLYCCRYFEESKYHFVFDKGLLKEMGSFAGWNYLGAGAYILRTQGLNILLNLFFGVAVNAARGIAAQVESAVAQFVSNFTMALAPQITKSFARDDRAYMYQLICMGAKFSYFMMLAIIVPIIYEAPIILKLWLETVPEFCTLFLRLTLVAVLFDTLSDTLGKAMLASGKIKKFHIYVSGLVIMIFPVSYLLYVMGYPVYSCYIVCILAMIGKLFFELPLLRQMIGMPITMYINYVIYRIIPVTFLCSLMPYLIYSTMKESVIRLIILSLFSLIVSSFVIYTIGMTQIERSYLFERIKLRIAKSI